MLFRSAGSDSQFNWGYDPKNYNAPEGSFSSNPYDGNVRINEVKQMVKALHDAGIGVIMDVVYNHTHEGPGSWFQQTVPNYYYRFSGQNTWSSGSGCGNDTASEHEMFRKYMVDSVTYWAKEYHIDGFRFDLMGLHDVTTVSYTHLDVYKRQGKRRLAYLINDEAEGHYVLINFKSEPDFPAELDRRYKITDGILRSLIVRKDA